MRRFLEEIERIVPRCRISVIFPQFFSPAFARGRARVRITDEVCTGMYLRDLTFAEEGGNEDFKGELINFEKLQIVGKVFSELHKFRAKGYEFPHDDVHGRFFQKLLVLPEEVLYKHSLMCEPSDKSLE